VFPTFLFSGQRLLGRQPWEIWPLIAGGWLLLLRRKWVVPFAIFIGLAPFYAFLAGVPNPWVFAPRYAEHVLPFAELAAAYALYCVPVWLLKRGGL